MGVLSKTVTLRIYAVERLMRGCCFIPPTNNSTWERARYSWAMVGSVMKAIQALVKVVTKQLEKENIIEQQSK
jgi:hypothetical protein